MEQGTVSNYHGVLSRKGPLGLAKNLAQNWTESWSKSSWCDVKLQLSLGLPSESSVDNLGAKWENHTFAKEGTVPSGIFKCQSSCWADVPRGNMVLWWISRLILGNIGSGVSGDCLHSKREVGSVPSPPSRGLYHFAFYLFFIQQVFISYLFYTY